jgi:hypothetical protein
LWWEVFAILEMNSSFLYASKYQKLSLVSEKLLIDDLMKSWNLDLLHQLKLLWSKAIFSKRHPFVQDTFGMWFTLKDFYLKFRFFFDFYWYSWHRSWLFEFRNSIFLVNSNFLNTKRSQILYFIFHRTYYFNYFKPLNFYDSSYKKKI